MDGDYCRRKLVPGEFITASCDGPEGCGHALVLHIGVEHCPVCELVDLAKQHREPRYACH